VDHFANAIILVVTAMIDNFVQVLSMENVFVESVSVPLNGVGRLVSALRTRALVTSLETLRSVVDEVNVNAESVNVNQAEMKHIQGIFASIAEIVGTNATNLPNAFGVKYTKQGTLIAVLSFVFGLQKLKNSTLSMIMEPQMRSIVCSPTRLMDADSLSFMVILQQGRLM
jgi:hypothetical protein